MGSITVWWPGRMLGTLQDSPPMVFLFLLLFPLRCNPNYLIFQWLSSSRLSCVCSQASHLYDPPRQSHLLMASNFYKLITQMHKKWVTCLLSFSSTYPTVYLETLLFGSLLILVVFFFCFVLFYFPLISCNRECLHCYEIPQSGNCNVNLVPSFSLIF